MGQALLLCRDVFMHLERFEEAVDHPLRARIPLRDHFLPEARSIVLSLFPALKHIGRIDIKITLSFASGSHIRSDSTLAPTTYSSFTHTKTVGNLLARQSLLEPILDLLIACLSLSSVLGDRPLDVLPGSRTPFLNPSPSILPLACRRCFFSLGVLQFSEDTGEQLGNSLRQIFRDMEAISDLNRLGSTTRGSTGILSTSISADMRYLLMGPHPRGGSFCLPVWQQVNDVVGNQIHQDCAEGSATSKREIINA